MDSPTRWVYTWAWVIALCFCAFALAYKFYLNAPREALRTIPMVGAVGSTHAHASLLVMDRNNAVSFCSKKYMLASQVAHFEDDDCTVVHKHATGVTLDTFLKTIEVSLTDSCLTITGQPPLCSDAKNTLRVVLNGEEVKASTIPYYELRNNDHILINYGPETGALLRFKYNQVPNIPLDVNEPLK